MDIDKGKKYILDSLPSKDTRSEMQSVVRLRRLIFNLKCSTKHTYESYLIAFFQISALGNYFAMGKLIDFSSFRAEKPTLKGQSNG